ncbi:MAG: hypothetical protein OEM98_13080 [Gammaproteobacteria bacterium]|nr:hypothetical protein [Gammaproteobacteria bacterium]
MDDHVKVVLEIHIGDLEFFSDLVPDALLRDPGGRASKEERLKRFSREKFQVVTSSGERLEAITRLVEPRLRKDRKSPFAGMINPITRQRVPEPPADKRVLYAELIYPFVGEPQELIFIPPLDEEGRALVTIGFIAYHKGVPIIDFRYLGAPARLALDWADPWYSRFDNPNLKRHHKSALMSFLYVEPYEVRHELLVRVKDMAEWMDLDLSGERYIEIDELEPLKQRISAFLSTKNPVRVDGQALDPVLDRADYVTVSLAGIQLLERPQRLEISTAIVGLIFAYLTPGMPKEVTVDWELFTDQIQQVPATATDPAGPLPTFLTPDSNVHTWTNFLKSHVTPQVVRVAVDDSVARLRIPLPSIIAALAFVAVVLWMWTRSRSGQPLRLQFLLAVSAMALSIVMAPYYRVAVARPAALAPVLSDEEAKAVLEAVLKNVYRAFDFRDEAVVYDKLALTISGELLADVYLQSRRSLKIQRAGGAQAKVQEVSVLEATAENLDHRPFAHTVKAKWTALGRVGHWGHVHVRKNQYEALVTLEAADGSWKITGLDLLQEERVDPLAQMVTQ